MAFEVGPSVIWGATRENSLFNGRRMASALAMDKGLEQRIERGIEIVEDQIPYFAAHFGKVDSEWKGDGSRVTEADLHLSQAIADSVRDRFGDDQDFSEELDHGTDPILLNTRYAWLVDPIDGTNNYARGIATCSISVALLEEGNPVYGLVYDHASRSLMHGGPPLGLFVGRETHRRRVHPLDRQSIISKQCLDREEARRDENALQARFKLRAMGSSAIHMAYAALGLTDGVIAHRVKSWDIAAGVAMMRAAGGGTRYFDRAVFPMVSFSAKDSGFGHIAGSDAVCDAMEEALGRRCPFRG